MRLNEYEGNINMALLECCMLIADSPRSARRFTPIHTPIPTPRSIPISTPMSTSMSTARFSLALLQIQ
jgi:hypothetical protein